MGETNAVKQKYGALEAGGTKMVVAVGDSDGRIIRRETIPTTTPEETMPRIVDFFEDEDIASLGVACFGPVDLNPDSPHYGFITSTPKTAWRNVNIVGILKESLQIPIGFDTDVNGSLLGEVTWGSSKGLKDVVYITIGTGIGGGIMSGGRPVHGMMHPELGHMFIPVEPDDTYPGRCPYHGHCFEGLASGPAIQERWGKSAAELDESDEAWELESRYIARALVNIILTLSPERIILGGGVMHQEQLFAMIRRRVTEYLNGYIDCPGIRDMDSYIIPASLDDDQGIMGALKLAMDAQGGNEMKKNETENRQNEREDSLKKDPSEGGFKERKRWLLFGLPFTFTKYTVAEDVLTIDTGFFKRNENDCYMYKIQDVQYSATLLERMAGLGTVICYTGDVTDPKLEIKHIKHSKDVKNYILQASERARIKRRTLNTLDIGAISDDIDLADLG